MPTSLPSMLLLFFKFIMGKLIAHVGQRVHCMWIVLCLILQTDMQICVCSTIDEVVKILAQSLLCMCILEVLLAYRVVF